MTRSQAGRRLTYFIKGAEWMQHAATEPRLQRLGISYGQLAVLMSIAAAPGTSASDLARQSGITAQSMGETVAALLRKSLIRREEGDDTRRRLRLTALPAGHQLLAEAEAILDEVEVELTADLVPEDVEAAKRLLGRLIANAQRRTS